MKNILIGILVFFLSLFAYTKLASPLELSINSITTNKTDNFTVTGTGKVDAKPDQAVISVGLMKEGPTVKATKDLLDTANNAIIAAVKKLGIDAKDIQTSGYNINPLYDYREGKPNLRVYQGSANLTIKIRDLEKVGDLTEAATNAGATQVGGLSFEIADKTKLENEAREKAVAQAKQTAENAARIAGFKLGRVVNYNEDFGGMPIPIYARTLEAKAADQAPAPQIEPGTNEITVTVSLSYEIR